MTPAKDIVPWRPIGDTGVHYWLVQRMAKTCGVDTADASRSGQLDQNAWADMVQTCRGCRWTEGCTRWLDKPDHVAAEEPPENCLNAKLLKLLAEEQAAT